MSVHLSEEMSDARKQQLREAAFHVWYEFQVLKHCGLLLRDRDALPACEYIVVMDAFLVHARNLNHFFHGIDRRHEARDVLAEHFFQGYESWEKPPGCRISEDEVDGINVQLAHISYERVRQDRSSWDFEGMLSQLTAAYEDFVLEAPESTLCDEMFREGLRGLYPRRA